MKVLVRGALGALGLEIFRARGGVFIVPKPRAGAPGELREFPRPIRLHLGCGNVRREGWVNIDIVPSPATDFTADISKLSMFGDGVVEEIAMEAVYEHLFRHERRSALREWTRILRVGGLLHIRYIPDFDVIAEHFVHGRPGVREAVFSLDEVYHYTHGDPAPWNAPEQVHKDLFTRTSLTSELSTAGLEVVSLESACFLGEAVALNLNVTARKVA